MPDNWVTVARLSSQPEYLLARARLDSAGIECFSPNEHTARLAGPMLLFSGEDRFILQGRPDQVDDARKLLDDPGDPFLVADY